jgi:inorganic pyrophosphatase
LDEPFLSRKLFFFSQVKVLGTLAMVDDGEADWKVMVIGEVRITDLK